MLSTHDFLLAFCQATQPLDRDTREVIFKRLCKDTLPPVPDAPLKGRRSRDVLGEPSYPSGGGRGDHTNIHFGDESP